MELAIEIKAKPGNLQELDQTLQALLPTIRKEKGCRDCRIYRDVEDGEIFFLSVHWEGQENLEKYLRSGSGMALLGAIDLLTERAAVRIGHDAPREGIDALKRMRRKHSPSFRAPQRKTLRPSRAAKRLRRKGEGNGSSKKTQ